MFRRIATVSFHLFNRVEMQVNHLTKISLLPVIFKDMGSFADKYLLRVLTGVQQERVMDSAWMTQCISIFKLCKKTYVITKPIESLPNIQVLVYVHHSSRGTILHHRYLPKKNKMCRSNLIRALRKKDIQNKDVAFLCYFLRQSETQMGIKQLSWQHFLQRYCLSYEFCHTL